MFYNKDEIKKVKYLAARSHGQIIDFLNLTDLGDRGYYYASSCPIHEGDNRTAFSIKKDDLSWKCWTHHCHTKIGGDIISLVRQIKKVSFTDAVTLLLDIIGDKKVDMETIATVDSNIEFCNKFAKEEYYDESSLKSLTKPEYILSRGFLPSTVKLFEVGHCNNKDSRLYNYDVLPIRDIEGNLVGFTNRNTDKNCEKKDRWKHEGKLHRYLFGIHLANKHINESRTAILVEGPLKMMKLWEAGIKNCVAIFGTDLSEEQHNMLLNSGTFTIIIATDRDEAGQKARARIEIKVNRFFYVDHLEFPYDDIDKVETSEVREFLKGSVCQEYLESESQESEKLAAPLGNS